MTLPKRWLLTGFGIIMVLVLSRVIYPSFVPPGIPFVNFQPEQGEETALRHLQLAHQYYYNGDVDAALDELSKAALSSQDEIAVSARQQVNIIKDWQTSPLYWVWSLSCWIWRNSIWILIVVVLLVLYLFQPIKNPRFILENIELLGLSPQNLQPAHILLEDLYLARQTIYNMRGSFLCTPMNVAMPQVIKSDQMIENLLNHFGKFKFSLIETDPGKLINTLRRLFNKKDVFINGSLIFQEKQIVLRIFIWQKGKVINSFLSFEKFKR